MSDEKERDGISSSAVGPRKGRETGDGRVQFRSHLLPRTRDGWVAVLIFFGLFILVEPPVVHTWANRVEPWLLGFPFLYTYLLVLYTLLVFVLIWALRRRI